MRTFQYRTTEGQNGFINCHGFTFSEGRLEFFTDGKLVLIFAPGAWVSVYVQPLAAEPDADRPDDGA